MKRILILLLGLFSVAYGQFSPTSAKSAFKWGVSIGTRDSTAYAANDSLVVVINRQGRLMYRSTDGYWKLLANAASSDYVPYTGAVDNVALGNFRITARSVKTDSIYANGSGGMYLLTNSGNPVAHWGAGGSVEVDFKGFAGYDANRSASYTARSFTDKNYVDSSAGLRVRYTDTAAMLTPYLRKSDTASMLSPFVQYSDTTGLYSQVVRTFGTQTIGGAKTFSSDIAVNSMRVGLGGGGQTQNVALGLASLNSNTTGTFNTSIGFQSLFDNTTAVNNTAVGSQSLANLTTGSNNIGIGANAGSISAGAADLTTNTNSIFLGSNTKASANGNTNEIVIGDNTTGNGSNTVTIGNSSITNNYFTGNIRGGAFIRSGGTSSQFLKADGSVDGTSYATAASISGTTNYIPKFTSSSAIGNSDLRTDANNNLGLGVNPSAWGSLNTGSFDLQNGSIYRFSNSTIGFAHNAFYNGTNWIYRINDEASDYFQENGAHYWRTAPSGTAGNVVSFTERLNLSSTALTSYVPINGTSLSMSGGAAFATSSGDVLIAGATTDGTNKLIVNGGVKGTGNAATISSFTAINANGASGTAQRYIEFGTGSTVIGRILRGNGASGYTDNGLNIDNFGGFRVNLNALGGSGGTFEVNGGAATFSSSVTANGDGTFGSSVGGSVITNFTVNGGSSAYPNIRLTTGGTLQSQIQSFGGAMYLQTNGATTALTLASNQAATFSSSVSATGFIVSSDRRLKNIIKRDGDVAYYKWKDKQDDKVHIGYIAQEVQKTNPDQVSENNGKLAVNYIEILVEKVRALEKEIEQLKRKQK